MYMSYIEVMKKFVEVSRIGEDRIEQWSPNGKGSVRVRLKDRSELIFTYNDSKRWRLETIESFKEYHLSQARRMMGKKE